MDKRENFGSRIAVIFAMAGSAIGLGNIWRFPYVVGEHGGSVFVLVYIIATLLISLPVFMAEVSIGRRSRISAYGSFRAIAPERKFFKVAGLLSIIIPFIIASYYSVIGGWSLSYFLKSLNGGFVNCAPDQVSSIFGDFISSTWGPVVAHLVFMALCSLVVAFGVKTGIEKFSKLTIPILFVLILAMMAYSISLPGAGAGVKYLTKLDFGELTPSTFAYAMGQSFYSLSLGMGAIITYGSYVHKDENLVASSVGTAVSDLMFAVLAGFAIMPAVFAAGVEPGAGPGLIFQSIPFIFASMGSEMPLLSAVMSVLFFLTIVVAAMTSLISLLEVGVAFLHERFGIRRGTASLILFVCSGSVGVVCSLNGRIFDFCDYLSSNILLLLLAFLTMVFAGFVMKKEDLWEEITNGGTQKWNVRLFDFIYFLMKWVTPIAIVLIFITNFIL